MSLIFVILRHVGVISHQERQLQKFYKVDFTGPPCSKTHMHSARLVKIVKSEKIVFILKNELIRKCVICYNLFIDIFFYLVVLEI